MTFALGAVLYHNVSLAEDSRPLEAFLDGFFDGANGLTQFCVPIAPRKERPVAFHRGKLLERVRNGELFSFLVGSPGDVEANFVKAGFLLSPPTAVAEAGLSGYRYRFQLAVGAQPLAQRSADAVVSEVVKLADAINPRAGAIFTAETAAFAHALATGGRGGLTEEQDLRVRDVAYAVHELGDKIRGPEWGTFLGTHHVDKLGGIERVETQSRCSVVRRLAGGGAYLQVTSAPPAPGAPAFAAELAAVAAYLAPVMT